jgi:Trk K+ transport system NAD-binding subunit
MAQSAKLAIPKCTPITLTHRGGAIIVSQGHTMLHKGDHLTIIGNPDGLSELATRYRGVGTPDDATVAQ